MPPTVQTGSTDRERKRPLERKSDIVCRVKYCNTLPDIPFDPKFISYPFLQNRFVEYKPTSLEKIYKHDLLTEHDLGVTIDLINPITYNVDHNAQVDINDEKLLEEDPLTPQDSKRSRHHNKTVPWLKKTEYISNEFNRYGHSSEKTETKVGYNVKKLFKEENVYMDRDSQITAIDKTFSDALKPIEKHYSKPGVYPVETLSLFPDDSLWRYPFAQVMFDTDPAPPTQMDEMSQAMIRGVMDESGEQFVAYFLPTEETMKKRKRDADEGTQYMDDDEYEYKMAREYNWNVKNKASKGYEENYFFVFKGGSVFYNELETRVRLSKRRLKPGVPPNNSLLVVKHRPLNETEFNYQQFRLEQLEPVQAEVEEEEDESGKSGAKTTVNMKLDGEESEGSAGEQEDEVRENDVENEEDEREADNEEEEEEEDDDDDREKSQEMEDEDDEVEEKDDEMEGKDDEEDEVEEKEEKNDNNEQSSTNSSSSESEKASSSESEAEEVDRKKRDEEEIFGSDSD